MGCLKLNNDYDPSDSYHEGMQMDSRSWSATTKRYRFAFNGKESDSEVSGEGNTLDFGARVYDSRLGRWMSPYPLFGLQPSWSPYKGFLDNPLLFVDPGGETEYIVNVIQDAETRNVVVIVTTENKLKTDGKHTVWDSRSTYHHENYYYDYATITVRIVNADGTTKSVEKSMEILFENGIIDRDNVWFGGEEAGETKNGPWEFPGGSDHGVERSFGICFTGGDGQDKPVGLDWSKNVIGSISIEDLETILKPSKLTKKYKPGAHSWQKLKKGSSLKTWLTFTKDSVKQGNQIGETVNAIDKRFNHKRDTTFRLLEGDTIVDIQHPEKVKSCHIDNAPPEAQQKLELNK